MDTNAIWETREVSTSDHILDEIADDMTKPISILLFGADGDFKNWVRNILLEKFAGLTPAVIGQANREAAIGEGLRSYPIVIIELDSKESASRKLRCELAKTMKNAGAIHVIGVYAKATKRPVGSTAPGLKSTDFNQQIDLIEQSRPSLEEGLTKLIGVKEAKKGERESCQQESSGVS